MVCGNTNVLLRTDDKLTLHTALHQMNVEFLFQRRHERYLRQLESWRRSAAAYSGGADYIAEALIRHLSEIEPEFLERRNRAYYFNYPRRIARHP